MQGVAALHSVKEVSSRYFFAQIQTMQGITLELALHMLLEATGAPTYGSGRQASSLGILAALEYHMTRLHQWVSGH